MLSYSEGRKDLESFTLARLMLLLVLMLVLGLCLWEVVGEIENGVARCM